MENTIIEARQELMVSPSSGENQTLRTAYFLKPCIKHSQPPPPPPHFSISSKTTTKLPLDVRYNGWRSSQEEWKKWVKKLQPKFESLWIQTGINHAIQASTYEIKRDDDLILELANKWCSKTNTFVFPWGETTITLEDTKVCFGYSVLGCSVFNTLIMNSEQKEAEKMLIEARRMFNSSKAKKVTQRAWMMHFMENENKVEHEAFLIYWLSRFVFPADSFETILKSVFSIAIHLAHGNRIALAPVVLASVYRDLSLLNNTINKNDRKIHTFRVTIWAPFQIVQVWAFERFLALEPRPYEKGYVLPKMARWGGVKLIKDKNLKKVLDCAGFRNDFCWQPYENSPFIEVYNEKDGWKCDNPCLYEELRSFLRCLSVCELVGMGCKENYSPHRIAMQFGMDQDIPGKVDHHKEDPLMSYTVEDIDLCIQLCSRTPGVSSRYYDWWNQLKSDEEGESTNTINGEESYGVRHFTSKFERNVMECNDKEDHLFVYEVSSYDDEVVENGKALFGTQGIGDFISSNVSDEEEINSLFCVDSFTLEMEPNDLENRIEKLERVIAKHKEARFGSKVEIV